MSCRFSCFGASCLVYRIPFVFGINFSVLDPLTLKLRKSSHLCNTTFIVISAVIRGRLWKIFKTMGNNYDYIVVGAGVEGSASAYQLAKVGKKTLLLEQFDLLHEKGSSHGLSRLIRRGYAEECLAMLMEEAVLEWQELEKLSGETIYLKTGVIQVGKKDSDEMKGAIQLLDKYKTPHQILNESTLKQKHPHLASFEEYLSFLDCDGGVLLADKGLRAFQAVFRKRGGEILDNCTVNGIQATDSCVTLETSKGTFSSRAVILCLGPWAGQFTSKHLGLNIPIQPQRPYFMYWEEKEKGSHSIEKHIPGFFDVDVDIYGFPSVEHPGLVKVCYDAGLNYNIDIPEDEEKPPAKLEYMCQYIKEHFPGLQPQPKIMGACKYSVTPDRLFILDKHPEHSNIVIGAGFSGRGFKFAPVVGIILRDLALGNPSKYDLTDFCIGRFDKSG